MEKRFSMFNLNKFKGNRFFRKHTKITGTYKIVIHKTVVDDMIKYYLVNHFKQEFDLKFHPFGTDWGVYLKKNITIYFEMGNYDHSWSIRYNTFEQAHEEAMKEIATLRKREELYKQAETFEDEKVEIYV